MIARAAAQTRRMGTETPRSVHALHRVREPHLPQAFERAVQGHAVAAVELRKADQFRLRHGTAGAQKRAQNPNPSGGDPRS